MKSSFFRKHVVAPDVDTRNRILKKLAILRNEKDRVVGEIKTTLRVQLKQTDGRTEYTRYHKGAVLSLGDENTRKKQFLIYNCSDDLLTELKIVRKQQKSILKSFRDKQIKKQSITYSKSGGIILESNIFGVANKKIKRQKVFNPKPPTTNDTYVGLELEFASSISLDEVADTISANNLQDDVRAMRDSSITVDPQYPYQIELCVLTKFSELSSMLDRLKKIIKPGVFMVNPTCGLHVHLDARNSNRVRTMFQNLVAVQSLLFSLVDDSRRENRYCRPVLAKIWEESDTSDHYAAISSCSYYKHKTIEIRIHQSTLDLSLVEKWVKLLKKISDYDGPAPLMLGTATSEFNQLRDQLEPDLINYIQERVAI